MVSPERKLNRLKGYVYSSPYSYFITICTRDRKALLSKINIGDIDTNGLKLKQDCVCNKKNHAEA